MIRRISALILALCMALPQAMTPAWAAATQLPPGEVCFQANAGTTGMVGLLGSITAGTGGTSGTYGGVALTGGSGTGATANITVAGGAVTAVVILAPGTAYVVGDVLSAASANIGNTSGFSVPVSSVSINGSLAGGKVFFYQPNTSIFKSTWTTSAQTTQNTNPVQLDANGCALIYGTGIYRQVVQDSLGNTIWDAPTTDVSANNNTFWAGTASALGTPNAIVVSDAGFNATDGSIINFIPIASNTGPATLNPCTAPVSSCFGAVSIVKDTAAGPVALSGGEIAIASGGLGNVVSVLYSASQNNFHLQNLIAAAVSASTPLCGAVGLKITNDTTFPNSKIVITADQINMQSAAGTYITRGTPAAPVSISVNFTVTGANGFDGAAGTSFTTSTWYNVYALDNGVAPAGLGSVSATAPTLPSGYGFKCRLGAVSTDSSGNFFRTLQLGNIGQYQVTQSTNTTTLCFVSGGTAGTYSVTSPTLVAVTVTGNGFCAPPTANAVNLSIVTSWEGNSPTQIELAPSQQYSGTNNGPNGSNGLVYPLWVHAAVGPIGLNMGATAWINLESTTVSWASTTGNGAKIALVNWKDKVNAQ